MFHESSKEKSSINKTNKETNNQQKVNKSLKNALQFLCKSTKLPKRLQQENPEPH